MGERITEDEVRRRLMDAMRDRTGWPSRWKSKPRPQRDAIMRWWTRPPLAPAHSYPAALKAVGIRWTGDHYEEGE